MSLHGDISRIKRALTAIAGENRSVIRILNDGYVEWGDKVYKDFDEFTDAVFELHEKGRIDVNRNGFLMAPSDLSESQWESIVTDPERKQEIENDYQRILADFMPEFYGE